MLVICVRRKYVTLIYDTTQAGGGVPRAGGGMVYLRRGFTNFV